MPKRQRKHASRLTCLLSCSRTRVIVAFTWMISRLHGDCPVPIEVLISGPWRRRSVERRLSHAIRRLQRAFAAPLSLDVAVVVQAIIMTERQVPGCYHISQQPDGSRFALIRLGLQVDGRRLSADELLAVLAEQYIALAMQSIGPSLLVPIDLDPPPSSGLQRSAALRPDPLAPQRDRAERRA